WTARSRAKPAAFERAVRPPKKIVQASRSSGQDSAPTKLMRRRWGRSGAEGSSCAAGLRRAAELGEEGLAERGRLVGVHRRVVVALVVLDVLLGQALQEARRNERRRLAAHHAPHRAAQVQPLARARDADVEEP